MTYILVRYGVFCERDVFLLSHVDTISSAGRLTSRVGRPSYSMDSDGEMWWLISAFLSFMWITSIPMSSSPVLIDSDNLLLEILRKDVTLHHRIWPSLRRDAADVNWCYFTPNSSVMRSWIYFFLPDSNRSTFQTPSVSVVVNWPTKTGGLLQYLQSINCVK